MEIETPPCVHTMGQLVASYFQNDLIGKWPLNFSYSDFGVSWTDYVQWVTDAGSILEEAAREVHRQRDRGFDYWYDILDDAAIATAEQIKADSGKPDHKKLRAKFDAVIHKHVLKEDSDGPNAVFDFTKDRWAARPQDSNEVEWQVVVAAGENGGDYLIVDGMTETGARLMSEAHNRYSDICRIFCEIMPLLRLGHSADCPANKIGGYVEKLCNGCLVARANYMARLIRSETEGS